MVHPLASDRGYMQAKPSFLLNIEQYPRTSGHFPNGMEATGGWLVEICMGLANSYSLGDEHGRDFFEVFFPELYLLSLMLN